MFSPCVWHVHLKGLSHFLWLNLHRYSLSMLGVVVSDYNVDVHCGPLTQTKQPSLPSVGGWMCAVGSETSYKTHVVVKACFPLLPGNLTWSSLRFDRQTMNLKPRLHLRLPMRFLTRLCVQIMPFPARVVQTNAILDAILRTNHALPRTCGSNQCDSWRDFAYKSCPFPHVWFKPMRFLTRFCVQIMPFPARVVQGPLPQSPITLIRA